MKRYALVLVALVLIATPAHAATKPVAVKKLDRIASAPGAEGLVIAGKNLVTYSNTSAPNTNVVVTGYDLNGIQVWQKTIDSGVDEIATTAGVDAMGSIWIAGSSAPVAAPDTSTAPVITENPDGVVVEAKNPLRADLRQITLWKISSTGDVIATYTALQNSAALVTAISINATGITLAGAFAEKSFIISANLAGEFSKIATLATSKTSINAVIRNSDGSINAFGSSSETLGGKKLSGVADGVLMKISKSGALTTVVRSSAPKASRAWLSATAGLALTGSVKTGKSVESAFTQFTSAFAPKWTLRVPSNGVSLIASAGTTYGAIGSTGSISGVSGWKPIATSLLLLGFDSKGVIVGAYGASDLASPIALAATKDAGVYGLAKASDESVSIFHLVTR